MSRLENWTYLLSKEVVDYWLNEREVELLSFEEAIVSLGLTGGVNDNQLAQGLHQGEDNVTLLEELEKIRQRIEENYLSESNSLEKIWQIESVLFNWYYGNSNNKNSPGCLETLEITSRTLRIETQKNFQNFINSVWLKSSPNTGFNYLSQIGALLFNLNDQYQAKRQSYFLEENGGKKSYAVLISKIIKSENQEEVNNNYNSAINALFHIYKCKIKGEIAERASHIIREVIQDYQLISDNLLESISFLEDVKESFLKTGQNSRTASMLYDEMCLVISPDVLRQEVEKDLGIPLNRWGSCGYITETEVKKILLNKMTGITKDIYEKIKQDFTSELQVNQEESNHFQLQVISN